ncbi:prolyl oligopeptidase family serine peptidase [Pedobacter sp. LMG 31464]|uniref:Prolyl oligopeptidase family serine peptidase n=1 Tax=Pedobacter planticolens TaxID=2679964 RepID=A0A923IX04_9SPHI|nr:prolyl oligopeptidase family serine peptidase [Pedobacter planticolens]MBB2146669.1 prolyl oligopeptidase family serine peptidase [Pedobacter planticolens]
MIVKRYVWIMLVALFFACKQENKVAIIPVDDFFKSQDKATYRISPDGKSLSYLKLQDKKQNLFVEDIATGKVVQLTHLHEKNINFYSWVSNNELIYYKEKAGERFQSDLFIINKEGTKERQLGSNEKSRIRVLEDQLIEDKFLLVLSNRRDSTVSDVYRLNVRDGKMEMAAQNPGNITNWMTDSRGKLRMAVSSDGVNETLLYRENEEQELKPIITNNFKTTLFPVAFSEDKPNIIYAISNVNRDKNALIELDCTTGKEKSVLFANDTLNVVDAQYSRQKGKMAYVVYETWKKEKHYLDDDAKILYQKLDKLLPKTESRIIDRDKNENVFVVRTFTDRNPGSYYLYSANSGTLKKLSDINSAINVEQMCEMKPISYIARDGLKINGYLTLPLNTSAKDLPVVVMPHNGPGLRNTWGFNAEVQFLANRGYAVLQVNYRGSTGYGKSFYAAGFKQWGAKIQDDVDDGVQWLINRKIANPQKIAIYGSGFGGYIALNGAIKSPKLYKCAASNSGVLNLFSYLKSIPPYFKSNLQMYYDVLGNPDTDVDYMRQASPVFHADKINIPIFITQNIKDPRINSSDAIQFVKELKKRNAPVTYFEKEETPFAMNREESRQKVYTALEQFLESNLKKK